MFGRTRAFLSRSRVVEVFSRLFTGEGAGKTAAGTHVSEETAMQVALFYRCLQVKSETLGSLPCKLYRVKSDEDGPDVLEEARNHPVYRVLRSKPNDLDSPMEFFVQGCLDLDLHGNWYLMPEYGGNGRLRALWRIPPECVEPKWVVYPKQVAYEYTPPSPDAATNETGMRTLMPGEIVHVKAIPATRAQSDYGLAGVGLLSTQRETIGLAIAARNYASEMMRNKAIPAGIITFRGNLDKKQREQTRQEWDDSFGPGKRGKTAVVNAQMDYKPLALNAVDAQSFENRMASNNDICTITGVPGFMVGVKSDTTYSNTREQIRAFHSVTISQLANRIAKGLEKALIPAAQREKYEIRFQLSDMLKGDDLARAKWAETMVRIGAFSPNDVLALEGRNPRPGGDVFTLLPGAGVSQPSGGDKPPAQGEPTEPSEPETAPVDGEAAGSVG